MRRNMVLITAASSFCAVLFQPNSQAVADPRGAGYGPPPAISGVGRPLNPKQVTISPLEAAVERGPGTKALNAKAPKLIRVPKGTKREDLPKLKAGRVAMATSEARTEADIITTVCKMYQHASDPYPTGVISNPNDYALAKSKKVLDLGAAETDAYIYHDAAVAGSTRGGTDAIGESRSDAYVLDWRAMEWPASYPQGSSLTFTFRPKYAGFHGVNSTAGPFGVSKAETNFLVLSYVWNYSLNQAEGLQIHLRHDKIAENGGDTQSLTTNETGRYTYSSSTNLVPGQTYSLVTESEVASKATNAYLAPASSRIDYGGTQIDYPAKYAPGYSTPASTGYIVTFRLPGYAVSCD